MEDTYKGQVDNPLSLNRYTYTHNIPLRYFDPTGHITVEEGWNSFKKGVSQFINPKNYERAVNDLTTPKNYVPLTKELVGPREWDILTDSQLNWQDAKAGGIMFARFIFNRVKGLKGAEKLFANYSSFKDLAKKANATKQELRNLTHFYFD